MRHIKTFKIFESNIESLKARLSDHYYDNISEFGEEEVENTIQILDEYDDNLTGLGKWDKTLLLRLVNDDELYQEVDEIGSDLPVKDGNLFDSYNTLLEALEDEVKKFSLVFDEKYKYDVISALKKKSIKYEESDSLYYHYKKSKCEIFAWAKSEMELIKIIPVLFIQILKVK